MTSTLTHDLTAMSIAARITDHLIETGGHEQRFYLGMSQISRPEEALVQEMLTGTPTPGTDDRLRLAMGYHFERLMLERLHAMHLLRTAPRRELVAAFDERFRGHIDGEFSDGSLLEIKSITEQKRQHIRDTRKLPAYHFQQVQLYLHHGGYDRAHVVYVARDSGQVLVKTLYAVPDVARELNDKARRVLARYDEALADRQAVAKHE